MKNGRLKRYLSISAALLIAMTLLVGCSSKNAYSSDNAIQEPSMAMETQDAAADMWHSDDVYETAVEEEVAYDESDGALNAGNSSEATLDSETGQGGAEDKQGTENTKNVSANRKLIKRVSMSVETDDFDSLTANLKTKVNDMGGYMENAYVSGESIYSGYQSGRTASYTIRIPASALDSFVTQVENISNVLSKNESAEDVTLQYVDLKSKKETLEVEKERLMVLLEKADSIETIVALESRLTEIRYSLESMESQLRMYDNLVDYATINIDVNEVERIVETPEQSSFDKITSGFLNSIFEIGEDAENAIIKFIINLPHLVVNLLFLFVFILIARLIIRAIIKRVKKETNQRSFTKDDTINQSSTEVNGKDTNDEEKQ